MGSIKWKLAILYMLLVVTVMTGQGVLILYNLRYSSYKEVYQRSEYMADRIVDVLEVQDLPEGNGAEAVFGDILTSLMIESVNSESLTGRESMIFLLDENGQLLYTRRDPLTQADLSSRAIMMARNGETMTDNYVHTLSTSGETVADYALRFTLPQNKQTYILFIRQSLESVLENIRQTTVVILAITGVGIVIAGFLGYLLAVSISKPIQRLTRKTQELQASSIVTTVEEDKKPAKPEDPSLGASIGGADEIDILEVNFDDMARELTTSIQELQAMEQMQKEFVANVSHELRTPITTIKSYVETLLDSELEDPELTRRFLGVVSHESDRMTALITDLLELSKMDSHQLETVRKPFDIGNLLRQDLMEMQWDAQKKHQRIAWSEEMAVDIDESGEFPWPQDEYVILGDARRIEQVIRNLLTNAIKYSPEGANIFGGVYRKDGEIIVEVRDNGIGISEEDAKHIFDRFYRVDKARSRSMGGTGLGLAIAKQTTELFGGRIWVESELGEGSTFFLAFPEAPEEADE